MTAIITLYTLQTKLRIAPVVLVETSLSRSSWRTCRARRDVPCRACFTACATQHVRFFPVSKCMG